MATSTIQGSGTNTLTINGMRYSADFSTNETLNGSASIAESFLIPVGPAWTPIDTGSVTNVGKVYLDNPNGPGTVQFASSSNATWSLSSLSPANWTWLSVTGSGPSGVYPLYARAVDSGTYVNVIIAPH